MMAHETPVPIHSKKNNIYHQQQPKKTNKKEKEKKPKVKPNDVTRILPSGQPVNFGHKKKEKENINTNGKKKANNNKVGLVAEDDTTYAGSSFSSSPAALNLPKPSFKSNTITNSNSPPPMANSNIGMPNSQPQPPPQYPVTAYGNLHPSQYQMQPQIQPGFSYQYSPNGFIQYQQFQGQPIYTHYQPNAFVQHQQQMNQQHSQQNQQHRQQVNQQQTPQQILPPFSSQQDRNQGQKISFNDLLSSSKKS